uniref:Skp1-related protein n=1 Tax=Caenorhabditis tropicalis TaxID=1561998 RepID=A0A1I7TN88_9PELO
MVVGQKKPLYRIRSCDGEVLVVEDWLIQKSKCFSLVFSYFKDSPQILQTTVSSYLLVKIIEWCYHHRHDEEDQEYRIITEWDADYLQANNAIIFHLVEAAFRLEIRGLVEVACRAVSIMIGRPFKEVRVMLRVEGIAAEHEELEEEEEEILPAMTAT